MLKRIIDKIQFVPTTGCWLWVGATSKPQYSGYGVSKINRKRVLMHRWFWESKNGDIPDGMKVLHHCDTPLCVNPDHLFLGTQRDNVSDMIRKGRKTSKIINLSGVRFGRWTVLGLSGHRSKSWGGVYWNCRCDCGTEKPVSSQSLLRGDSRQCRSCRQPSYGRRKITALDAEMIRRDCRSLKEIAEDYPIGKSQIANIKCGISWNSETNKDAA